MIRKTIAFITLLSMISLWSCQTRKNFTPGEIAVIPKPAKMELKEGSFLFNKNTRFIVENEEQKAIAGQLADKFEKAAGFKPQISIGNHAEKNAVIFRTGIVPHDEGYLLNVIDGRVEITASNPAGFFYGIQTLRQLLPVEIESNNQVKNINWWIPNISISDNPRFEWRGFMLDVSRHFFPKEYIIELIDYLSLHKVNTFHWHLVDDQGWRIEIKKYPKLTEIGAWRVDHEDKHWNTRPGQKEGEKATYGGYYSQEDIKEIVAFASSRQITIVPEIEMPAHVTSALAAYPEFSCTGGPFMVPPGGLWPITDIYCAGNDATFNFLEDVLTEVMELFPSRFIHIGGDEATKTEWEKCPKCRERMRTEELENVEELQSYFIKRMERFISSKGRRLIGWDEILEGGLAPQATVMSWRGFEGGIEAAEQGHDVVMTPLEPCYFNLYQGPVDQEPVSWGGYIPISKVYGFDPVHESMSEEAASHVLGGQANLWTEFITEKELAMYMIFPRLAALAEKLWTPKTLTDWTDFSRRLPILFSRYDQIGINYAKSVYLVLAKAEMLIEDKTVILTLTNELTNPDIRYVLGDTELTKDAKKYSEPLEISESTIVKAALFENDKVMGKMFVDTIKFHNAVAKRVNYITMYSDRYQGQGDFTLTNAVRGSKNFHDGQWQGWIDNDMEVIIDLENEQDVQQVMVGTLEDQGSGIYFPVAVEVSTSTDGHSYQKQGELKRKYNQNGTTILNDFVVKINPTATRFVKVKAVNLKTPPNGGGSWLFVDEITVK